MRVNYAIVFVSDMGRSVAFYRDALGLPLKFESIGWSEFATEGATLALHLSGASEKGDSRSIVAGRCRPGLRVPNLDEFHKRAAGNGVTCVQEPKEQFGVRIAQYADPDGLVISVSEGSGGVAPLSARSDWVVRDEKLQLARSEVRTTDC